ncbi:unnamed protein product, partial [Brassica rapa]
DPLVEPEVFTWPNNTPESRILVGGYHSTSSVITNTLSVSHLNTFLENQTGNFESPYRFFPGECDRSSETGTYLSFISH